MVNLAKLICSSSTYINYLEIYFGSIFIKDDELIVDQYIALCM